MIVVRHASVNLSKISTDCIAMTGITSSFVRKLYESSRSFKDDDVESQKDSTIADNGIWLSTAVNMREEYVAYEGKSAVPKIEDVVPGLGGF